MKTLLLNLILTLLTGLTYAQVSSPPSKLPSSFVSRVGDDLYDEWEDTGTKLSASIFNSITDQEFFKTQLFGHINASLKVQRLVFDNQDILDTWTVIDFMRIPLDLPIPLYTEEIGFGAGGFGINMGLNFGGEALHIRQVKPEGLSSINSTDTIEETLKQIQYESLALTEDALVQDVKKWDYTVIEEQEVDRNFLGGLGRLMVWKSQSPRLRARYEKIWNLLTHPLGIPLTAAKMDEYPTGEIASYGLTGGVQLGLRAGWSEFEVLGGFFTDSQASLGITTYLTGNFNISLWKESPSTAQVKVTRKITDGITFDLGRISFEKELFEGFMVLDQRILRVKESFVPFSFNVNKSFAREFEVGYRYDLINPKAREAYEDAVLGRFKKSHDYSLDGTTGVVERFTKKAQTNTEAETYHMKLSILFEKSSGNVISNTKARIKMDGVEHDLNTSKSLVFNSYDTLWGTNESRRHEFVTTLSQLANEEEDTPELGMRITGRIEDGQTNGEEINSYIDELETTIQRPGTLPRPPIYLPKIDCQQLQREYKSGYEEKNCQAEGDNSREKAKYGRTSFLYQVDLDLDHLLNIRNASKDEFWNAFEIAFNVDQGNWSKRHKRILSLAIHSPLTLLNLPLSLINVNLDKGGRLVVAYRFYLHWLKLKKIEDPKELVKEFGKLYDTVHYGAELAKATRILAGDADANFIMNAKSDELWGTISESQGTLENKLPIYTEEERRSQFDRIGPRINVDNEAVVNKIEVSKLDEERVMLTFDLKEQPNHLYLRIDRTSSWSRYQNLLKIIVPNNNNSIKKGITKIIISKNDSEGLPGKLRNALFNGKQSHILIAYSISGENYGPVSSVKFRLDKYEQEELVEIED